MRVDKYLSRLGLVKRASIKEELTNLKINGIVAKPSKKIKVGDVIEFISSNVIFKIEVLRLPEKRNVATKERENYFRLIYRRVNHREIKSEFIKWLLED